MEKTKRHLLFVDDECRVLDSIRRSLRGADDAWVLFFANSVDEAIAVLKSNAVDVVITDITMPGRDGFDLIGAVAADPQLNHVPVLVLTGLADENLKRRALDAGAFDLIGKPVRREDLIARIRSVLRTKDYRDKLAKLNETLEQQVAERTREVETSRTDILVCLAMAGECRDSETGRHLLRVARYGRRLAQRLGLRKEQVDTIFKAAPLHDIGKLGIPDSILLKPGPLSASERAIMQTHCEAGHRILTTPAAVVAFFDGEQRERSANPLLEVAADIALSHHERWDGTGYPRRLTRESIPLAARIVAVADVYDALTTRRPYKEAMSHVDAMKVLCDSSETHFDPKVIEALRNVESELDEIRMRWCDTARVDDNSISTMTGLPLTRKIA